ncbi:transporter substrate-binding domain-containing protein [Pleurocapsales cyanobacterium LEGE 10410]|nr:transporter substrate-binding domain-containing protein [Pleurocapsales cyanobacterium LEGE 10410]
MSLCEALKDSLTVSIFFRTACLAIALIAATPQSIIAEEWSEIESRGELKVAIKNNVRPLGFNDDNGDLVGLEIDIARKLAEELLGDAEAVEFLPVNNQERLQVVLEDRVDLAIARVAVTTPRSRIVDFSPYYYLDGTGIVTKNSEVKNLDGLTRSRIAVLENSATIAVIRNRLPNATLVGADSYQEALEIIETNQADAFAGDRSVLTGWVQEYPSYKLLSERLSGAALAVVMPKGLQYLELHQKVDRTIARWKESGWLEERIEYWGL